MLDPNPICVMPLHSQLATRKHAWLTVASSCEAEYIRAYGPSYTYSVQSAALGPAALC